MELTQIQIVLVCFAVFAISRVLLRFRRRDLPLWQLGLWFLFWVGVIVVTVRPVTTSVIASWVGVGRGADLAIYFALMLLFYLVFRLFGKVEDLERQITRVVRAAALKELDGLAPRAPTGAPPGGQGGRPVAAADAPAER